MPLTPMYWYLDQQVNIDIAIKAFRSNMRRTRALVVPAATSHRPSRNRVHRDSKSTMIVSNEFLTTSES
jgi:hypothetical protein